MQKLHQNLKLIITLFFSFLLINSCGTDEVEPNHPPSITNALGDLIFPKGFGSQSIDISTVFTDSDGDNLSFSTKNSDQSVVTVSLSGTTLTITEKGIGKSTITLTANDGKVSLDEVFTFEVMEPIPVENRAPVVSNPVADMFLIGESPSQIIDISAVFTDPDGDNLTFTASSSDNSIATVSLSGTNVTITGLAFQDVDITLTADDGKGGTATDQFRLTLIKEEEPPNAAPVVENALNDLSLTTGFGSQTIDVATVFTDPDGNELILAVSSADEAVATASLSGTTLTITEKGKGSTTITLTADDQLGGTAQDEFSITISAAANQTPTVSNPLADLELVEGFGTENVDISNVFADADGDNLTITASSTNNAVATVSISGNSLVITEQAKGDTTITLTADDGKGGTVTDQFNLKISAPTVSFASQVKPIIDTNCAIPSCHVAGTGRVDFTKLANIQANAQAIKSRTASGNMPKNGSLTTNQKKLIADWVDQGAKDN